MNSRLRVGCLTARIMTNHRVRLKVLFVPAWYPPPGTQSRVSGTFCREHVHAAALRDDVAVLVFGSRDERGASLKMELYDDGGIPTWYGSVGRAPVPWTNWLVFRVQLRRAIGKVAAEWGSPDVIHTQDHYAPLVMRSSRR